MRTFTMREQLDFAELSGDHNPVHVDPVQARRLLYGEPVVHGVHLLLWGLDVFLARLGGFRRLVSIRAIFSKPVRLDRPVTLEIEDKGSDVAKLLIICDGQEAARVNVVHAERQPWPRLPREESVARRQTPREYQGEALEAKCDVSVPQELLARMFPALGFALAERQVGLLLASTYIVGMEVPGMHSLFAEFELAFDEREENAPLSYRTSGVDPRFSLLSLVLDSGDAHGRIRALLRPPPARQPGFDVIRPLVRPDEFSGQRALIIGASRGLGEIAAKLLAAGGASTFLTWRSGADDMAHVVSQINAAGMVTQTGRYDSLAENGDDRASIAAWNPTHLYYFATPFIQSGRVGHFDEVLYARFCAVYLKGLIDLVDFLAPGLRAIFCPSSVHVARMPDHLREYALAKAGAEFLCEQWARKEEGLQSATPRLPPLLTDQTAFLRSTLGTASDHQGVVILRDALRLLSR